MCAKWYQVAQDTSLWSDCSLVLTKENKEELEECLLLPRFFKAAKLKLFKAKLTFQDFTKICNSRIKSLTVTKCNLKGMQAKDLAKFVNTFQNFNFDHSRTSSFQLKCILTSISPETNLKILDMSDIDLSNISPEILSEAVNIIEEVNLEMGFQASLTTNQIKAILSRLAHFPNSKLKKLNLSKNVLYNVPSDLLAFGVNKLEKVELRGIDVFREQMIDIFEIVAEKTNLKSLDISENNLVNVQPQSLIKSIVTLEEVTMKNVQVSEEQFLLISKVVDNLTYSNSRYIMDEAMLYYTISEQFAGGKIL